MHRPSTPRVSEGYGSQTNAWAEELASSRRVAGGDEAGVVAVGPGS